MTGRKIVWSKMALKDAGATIDFWDEHTLLTVYSDKLIVMIERVTRSAVALPQAGINSDVPDVRYRRIDDHYMLIYKVPPYNIRILSL